MTQDLRSGKIAVRADVFPTRPWKFKTQSVFESWNRDSISHLYIELFTLDASGSTETPAYDAAGNPVAVDVPHAELDNQVNFAGLTIGQTYRLRCFAFKAPGFAEADMISTTDASSYTDITVPDTVQVSVVTLKVQLANAPYNSQAGGTGIVVTPGGLAPVPFSATTSAPVPTPPPPAPTPAQMVATFTTNGLLSTSAVLLYATDAAVGVPYSLSVDRRVIEALGERYILGWGLEGGTIAEVDLGAIWPPADTTITSDAGSLTVQFLMDPPIAFPATESVTITN